MLFLIFFRNWTDVKQGFGLFRNQRSGGLGVFGND